MYVAVCEQTPNKVVEEVGALSRILAQGHVTDTNWLAGCYVYINLFISYNIIYFSLCIAYFILLLAFSNPYTYLLISINIYTHTKVC